MREASVKKLANMLTERQRAEVLQLAKAIEQQRAAAPEIRGELLNGFSNAMLRS